ncbi:unnamed protein product [Echinostoma caproni]|uniref:Tudor domain-containing protein n=1 Tax=Echinostoma caproni TaxID=27848 RepID=A0A183AZZ6_9TREM|nr:unnamed protein product [Echinostoma caproni]
MMSGEPSITYPIGKRVRLYCDSNRTFEGYVYTIDPVSGNYVIFRSLDHPYAPTIVSGEMVSRVEELESPIPRDKISSLFEKFDAEFALGEQPDRLTFDCSLSQMPDTDELERRRLKVIQLFSANRIDLVKEENGVLSVNNVVFIAPPYTINHCTGSNVVVLNRVKKLMESIEL